MKMYQIAESAEVSLEVTIIGTLYKKGHYVILHRWSIIWGNSAHYIELMHTSILSSTGIQVIAFRKNACLHGFTQVSNHFFI